MRRKRRSWPVDPLNHPASCQYRSTVHQYCNGRISNRGHMSRCTRNTGHSFFFFFLNKSSLFIVSAMSTAGKRSSTISKSLCNAIATYSWQYGIWYQVPYLVLLYVRVTIILEALVLGACQPCNPSMQVVPLLILVVKGTLQSTIWHLKVCGVDSADARPGVKVFRVFQVLVIGCLSKFCAILLSEEWYRCYRW